MFSYGKREANLIKGVAIIMMFIHHLFGFPNWITEQNMYVGTTFCGVAISYVVAQFCKLCVGLFAFTTGYSMFVQKERYSTFSLCLLRAIRFLKQYWLIYICFLIVGVILKEPLPDLRILVLQLFGIHTATGFDWSYNTTIHPVFAWYVSFYLIFLMLNPLLVRISKWNFTVDSIIYFFGLNLIYVFLLKQPYFNIPSDVMAIVNRFATWGSIGMFGYVFAKYDIFICIDRSLRKVLNDIWLIIFCCTAIALIVIIRWKTGPFIKYTFSLDFIYTPILIYAIITLLNYIKITSVEKILNILQRNSTNMWFLHGIFFTPDFSLQWLAYFPKVPVLILPWTLLLTLSLSAGITVTHDYIYGKVIASYNRKD